MQARQGRDEVADEVVGFLTEDAHPLEYAGGRVLRDAGGALRVEYVPDGKDWDEPTRDVYVCPLPDDVATGYDDATLRHALGELRAASPDEARRRGASADPVERAEVLVALANLVGWDTFGKKEEVAYGELEVRWSLVDVDTLDASLEREMDRVHRDYNRSEGCGTNTCDADAARRHGHVLWGAQVLAGASEFPGLDAILGYARRAMGDDAFQARLTREAEAFVSQVPHVACPKCNAVCWGNALPHEEPATCDNCGHAFDACVECRSTCFAGALAMTEDGLACAACRGALQPEERGAGGC